MAYIVWGRIAHHDDLIGVDTPFSAYVQDCIWIRLVRGELTTQGRKERSKAKEVVLVKMRYTTHDVARYQSPVACICVREQDPLGRRLSQAPKSRKAGEKLPVDLSSVMQHLDMQQSDWQLANFPGYPLRVQVTAAIK